MIDGILVSIFIVCIFFALFFGPVIALVYTFFYGTWFLSKNIFKSDKGSNSDSTSDSSPKPQ